jgi:hypothetical protein
MCPQCAPSCCIIVYPTLMKCLILLVPGEGLEPPTNGLQNRCSTAELTWQINGLGKGGRQTRQPENLTFFLRVKPP